MDIFIAKTENGDYLTLEEFIELDLVDSFYFCKFTPSIRKI